MAIPGFLNEILLRILPEFQVIAKGLYSNFCRDRAMPGRYYQSRFKNQETIFKAQV